MFQDNGKSLNFTLPNENGQEIAISQFYGRFVVLYCYPKDNTKGCTQEALEFKELLQEFTALNAQIIGLSADPPEMHQRFSCRYALPFPLLSDQDKGLLNRLGVWKEKSLYGRKFWGIERSTFLLSPKLEILKEWRKVSPKGHAALVLKTLQSMQV